MSIVDNSLSPVVCLPMVDGYDHGGGGRHCPLPSHHPRALFAAVAAVAAAAVGGDLCGGELDCPLPLSFFLFMIAGVDCQNRLPLY